jgi:hypothetical protein
MSDLGWWTLAALILFPETLVRTTEHEKRDEAKTESF